MPWQSGASELALLLPEAWVQSLVGELRSCKPTVSTVRPPHPATHSVALQGPLVPRQCNERVTPAAGQAGGCLMSPVPLLGSGKRHYVLSPEPTSESWSTLWSRKPPVAAEQSQNFHFSWNKLRIFFDKAKGKPIEWEKIFANHTTDKGSISKLCKQLIQLSFNKGKQLDLKKWAGDLNLRFF